MCIFWKFFRRDCIFKGLLGHINLVSTHHQHNSEKLKEGIGGKDYQIPLETLCHITGNMGGRLKECLHRDGGHLQDSISRN
jgi:hypothetical protein